MGMAFKIFKRDLGRLLRNPVAIVITIGVCIIPSLYAWYNIVANWDPYGKTGNVPVAVVNLDTGTTNDYVGELNAGDEAVKKIRDNHDLGWEFVDTAEEAKEGVESGKYYAAFVIPKDFSANLTSMLTGTFKQPKITYYVNQKRNAIAPEVTGVGATTLENQINQTFVGEVGKVVSEELGTAAEKLDGTLTGSESGLLGTVNKAGGAIEEVRTSLSNMTATIDQTKTAISDAQDSLGKLQEALPGLSTALNDGDKLLTATRATARDFTTSLSTALAQGNVSLGQASARANSAIGTTTGTIVKAQGSVDAMLDDARDLIQNNQDIIDALKEVNSGTVNLPGVADVLDKLNAQNEKLRKIEQALQTQSDDIKDSATAAANLSDTVNGAVQNGITTVTNAQSSYNSDVLPKLTSGLDGFSAVSGDLSGVLMGLTPSIRQSIGTLDELNSTLDQAKETIGQVDDGLAGIAGDLQTAANDIAALRSSDALSDLKNVLDMDADDVEDFMTSPVELETKTVYPVSTYGEGVAPFYTNLAIWVGGFVLIALYKLEVDPDGLPTFTPAQGYFGRWLLMILLGQLQAIIVCTGDLVLGVQNVAPGLFILAGMVESFAYVNIIVALAYAFRHIGKAVAVVLVIIQIPGASGIYPIEMMPAFYRALYPLLPFTYGINAMRETVAGMYGLAFWQDLAVLFIYVVLALLVGVVLRPYFMNLNLLFDRALHRTDLMICEENDQPNERFRLRTVVRAMLADPAYRTGLIVRARRFERRYPQFIRGGFALVFGLPVLLFVLMTVLDFGIEGKVVLLVLWIAAIIVADTYMIAVEYVRANLAEQLAQANDMTVAAHGDRAGAAQGVETDVPGGAPALRSESRKGGE